jgi:tRNA pseudouridine38-40 synthase
MPRFFLEVSYHGRNYRGFQVQENANTVQAEVEKAFGILFKTSFEMTGSSRTDAGVHALSNFFHFDTDVPVDDRSVYKLNAILPGDVVIKRIIPVPSTAHARFDATSRSYEYRIYRTKNPFLNDRAFFFPYKLNTEVMQEAASLLKEYNDFSTFSKRNSQVKTHQCKIMRSEWIESGEALTYHVQANRFLRGMVRGLTGTMLKVGTGKTSLTEFREIIESLDVTRANFAVPGHGLFLVNVEFGYELGGLLI